MLYLIQNRRSVMTFYDRETVVEDTLRFLARDCRGTWVYQGDGQFVREGPSETWEQGHLTATLMTPMRDGA